MNAHDILRRPVMTEKSMAMLEELVYVFEVLPSATKVQISAAVEEIFSVKVKAVNTLNRRGKEKRFRNKVGRQKNVRHAMVRLEDGHKLSGIFEV